MNDNLSKVFEAVRAIRAEIKASVNDPVTLSDLAIKAVTVNSYLGDYLGEAKSEYELARAEAFNKYYEEKPSISYAEEHTRVATAHIKAEIHKIETLHKDIERIVSTIQTKIRILEAQMKGNV